MGNKTPAGNKRSGVARSVYFDPLTDHLLKRVCREQGPTASFFCREAVLQLALKKYGPEWVYIGKTAGLKPKEIV